MNAQEFRHTVESAVKAYLAYPEMFDGNPQLRVNPDTLEVMRVDGSDLREEIETSDEAVENAAIAQGAETEEASDYQVTQNPDFYAIKSLVREDAGGKSVPDVKAIDKIVNIYFK